MHSESWLSLKRIVRFGDTDAAGVMHFYQLLRWCHEAWEESLHIYGLSPDEIFPNLKAKEDDSFIALPIVHCKADFLYPLQTGDHLEVGISPIRLDAGTFQVETIFKLKEHNVANGLVRHCAINVHSRSRCDLPEGIVSWLEASS
tara:strand:+ start:1169 stop:1603 length:435 start_codon:yes stop_codon:yes gene_type:complete